MSASEIPVWTFSVNLRVVTTERKDGRMAGWQTASAVASFG